MSSKKNEAKKERKTDMIPSGMAHRALLQNSQTAQPAKPDFTKRRPGSLSRSILAALLLSTILYQPSTALGTITVTGLVSQITSEALQTSITFTPAQDILLLTNGLSAGPAKTISSASNGGFTNTFNPGTYLVRLPLVSGRNAFTIAVPHGSGIENITNLIAAPWTYEQFVNTTNAVTPSGLAAGSYAQPSSVWLNKPSGMATNYSSLSAAKTASAAGDVITATAINVGATNLLKNGVDYDFRGVTISHSNRIPQSAGMSLAPFDDRGQGALTNTVKGIKLLDYRSQVTSVPDCTATNPFVNSTAWAAITITNPSSFARLDIDRITHSILGNLNQSAGIFVKDCVYSQFRVGEIIDPFYASPDIQVGLDEFDTPVTLQSIGAGIYWEHGEMHVNVDTIMGFGYGFYANAAGVTKNYVENYWHSGHLIYSAGNPAIYTVGNTNNYRMWFDVLQVESAGGQAITLFGSQRFYLLKNSKTATTKNGAFAISLGSTGKPEAWITSQKVSSTNGGFAWLDSSTQGTLDISCQEYIDNGTSGSAIGFRTQAGTNIIHGGRAKVFNGKGISHEGGRTFAENLFIDTATTTNSANNPISVSAAGLVLKDCVLIAPAGTDSITASSAQSVHLIGNVYANTAKNANITFTGSGTFTVVSSLPRL